MIESCSRAQCKIFVISTIRRFSSRDEEQYLMISLMKLSFFITRNQTIIA